MKPNSIPFTPIQEFYHDSFILITGGTGFLGKLLLEKLLYSCPSIRKICLIARHKKGKTVQDRLDESFKLPIFNRLRKKCPNFDEKIIFLEGDLEESNLGLSKEDLEFLISQVNIVFHAAATVRFDEPLKVATRINVSSTKEILQLCCQMKNLKSVIHVSTAYSNCIRKEIDEVFYPPHKMNAEEFLKMCSELSTEELDKISPGLIEPFPNTYTFTKSMGEDLVQRYQKLPIAVVRPSIVVSTWMEPMRGWVENLYGPIGIIAACAAGVLRILFLSKNTITDQVPMDLVVNSIIAAAWDCGTHKKPMDEIKIYNYVSSVQNPINWGNYMFTLTNFGFLLPYSHTQWYYILYSSSNKYVAKILEFFLHTIPAHITDTLLKMSNQKPRMLKIYDKIYKMSDSISYFILNEWKFHNSNTRDLWSKLSISDQDMFNFNMEDFDWDLFLLNTLKAVRRHVLKEPDDKIKPARDKMKRLAVIHFSSIAIFLGVILYCLYLIIFKYFF